MIRSGVPLIGRTLAIVLAMVLTLLAMPSATAQDDLLEVSLDGVTWSRSLPEALFRGDVVLVPGGAVSAELHLRSAAPSAGVLELALKNVYASDHWAAKSFGFQVEVAEAGGGESVADGLPRTRFIDLAERTSLGTPLRLDPGETVVLTVTIDFDSHATGNRSQNSAIGLDLLVSFADAFATGGDASGGDGNGGDASGWATPVDPGHEGTPEQVISVFGTEGPGAATGEGVTSGSRGSSPAGDDSRASRWDRGLLAVTGTSAFGVVLGASALLVLGAVLLFVSRRRHQEGR